MSSAGKPQVIRSVGAVIIWWLWVLFALGNLIDLAVQGRDHLALVAAAIIVLVTGVAYVTAQRPRVTFGDDEIAIRNPVRDHRAAWADVTGADLADLLRVYARSEAGGKPKPVSAWAVHYSRRRQYTAQMRARRGAQRGGGGFGGLGGLAGLGGAMGGPGGTQRSAEAEAESVVSQINNRARGSSAGPADGNAGSGDAAGGARIPAGAAVAGGWHSTWNRPAIASLLVPALLLLIVALA